MFRDARTAAHAKEKALRKAAEKAPTQAAPVVKARRCILKRKGSAGNGFRLIEVMELDKNAEGEQVYLPIQVSTIISVSI